MLPVVAAKSLLVRRATRCIAARTSPWFSPNGSSSATPDGRSFATTPLPPVLSPPNPPQPQNPVKDKGLVGKAWNRFSVTDTQNRIRVAEAFLQAATRQGADPMWYGPGRIPREFRSRHALLTMHLWFLHKRLVTDEIDKDNALMIQEELFNIFWEDTTCRIRKEGVNELLVNKTLLTVQQYTFLHLTNYDHIYTELLDKPAERLKELRKLVWQHIFVRDEAVKARTDHLDRLAWYIEANYQNIIMELPDEYYRKGRVAWVNLPDFHDMKDEHGNVMPLLPVNPDDVLPEPWLSNVTLQGVEYYWNPMTMKSSWERPGVDPESK